MNETVKYIGLIVVCCVSAIMINLFVTWKFDREAFLECIASRERILRDPNVKIDAKLYQIDCRR